jgi:hypothetical protein
MAANVVVRRMSITRADFLRTLAAAVLLPLVAQTGNRAMFAEDGRRLIIRYRPEEPLRLGSLILPVLAVELAFTGFDRASRDRAIGLFDKMYQRGGG